MKKTAFFCLVFLTFFTCRKEEDIFVPDPKPETIVQGSVGGQIADTNGQAISQATIQMLVNENTHEALTDENGIFYFRNVELNTERTYLSVLSPGYHTGSRTFVPQKEGIEFVNIQLMPLTPLTSFSAADGAEIDIPGGGAIDIPANGIQTPNAEPHTGPVHLAASLLLADDPDAGLAMPGNLTGMNADGEWRALSTFGMMTVELNSDEGHSLQLKEGNLATVRIPLSDNFGQNAPNTLLLWRFTDEGYWKEEGSAQLTSDNYYEGEISRIGIWNVSMPYPMVRIGGLVHFAQPGKPYPNAPVAVNVVGAGLCAYGYTDNNGTLDFNLPASQVLLLQVFGYCGEVLYETEFGPFQENAELSSFSVGQSTNDPVQLSGKLVDCNGEPVSDGYIRLAFAQQQMVLFTTDSGNFNAHFDACQADQLQITGYDITRGKQSTLATFNPNDVVATGNITACN